MEKKKDNAAKVVSSAILGMDYRIVMVGGHRYVINPPTIKRIAGAAVHLADVADAKTVGEILTSQSDITEATRALSCLIQGDESLADALAEGTLDEVVKALTTAYELISVQPFMMLSTLARSVARMAANQRQ